MLAVLQPWSFRVQVHVVVHMLLLQHSNGRCRKCGLGAVLAVLQPWSFRVQVHVLVHMLLLQHSNGKCRNCGLGAVLAVLQPWSFRCMYWCTCCFCSTPMEH